MTERQDFYKKIDHVLSSFVEEEEFVRRATALLTELLVYFREGSTPYGRYIITDNPRSHEDRHD
jgi:hypothetical protein